MNRVVSNFDRGVLDKIHGEMVIFQDSDIEKALKNSSKSV